MMFRHHQDPLYYDTQASSKIFVPVAGEEMNEAQRAIVESFPAEDRGQILNDAEYASKGYGLSTGAGETGRFVEGQGGNLAAMIELDEVEAAMKRHRLKEDAQKAKLERKR